MCSEVAALLNEPNSTSVQKYSSRLKSIFSTEFAGTEVRFFRNKTKKSYAMSESIFYIYRILHKLLRIKLYFFDMVHQLKKYFSLYIFFLKPEYMKKLTRRRV